MSIELDDRYGNVDPFPAPMVDSRHSLALHIGTEPQTGARQAGAPGCVCVDECCMRPAFRESLILGEAPSLLLTMMRSRGML